MALGGKLESRFFLFFFCFVKLPDEIVSTIFFLFHWKLCLPCTNAVCHPSLRAAAQDLVYYLREERRGVASCLALFCLWWFYFATVVQEPSISNTTLPCKSLLKHWRSYPRCDWMGLHYHVSWLLMDRLFIPIGFTTSLISSLLSLTKVLLFHSVCKKNTSEASRWALDCLCYRCVLCAAL